MNTSARTAITRTKPSRPLRDLLDSGLLPEPLPFRRRRTLDFGCGKGADVDHMWSLGYCATGYDPGHANWSDPSVLGRQFEVVTCIYVLNTIKGRASRMAAMMEAADVVVPGGLLFVATRSVDEVVRSCRHGVPTCDDDGKGYTGGHGYTMNGGTYQIGISLLTVIDMADAIGLKGGTYFGRGKYTGALFRK